MLPATPVRPPSPASRPESARRRRRIAAVEHNDVVTSSPSPESSASTRWSVTGRAVILVVVVVALSLSLALPVREFVQQRSRLTELSDRASSSRVHVAELTQTRERWNDPAYVAAQARQRLQLVLPGEVPYVVLEPDPSVPWNP